MAFEEIEPKKSQILSIRRILESVGAKHLEATILSVDFSRPFDSLHRERMEQIPLAYNLPKETVAAIMIIYVKHLRILCLADFNNYVVWIISKV